MVGVGGSLSATHGRGSTRTWLRGIRRGWPGLDLRDNSGSRLEQALGGEGAWAGMPELASRVSAGSGGSGMIGCMDGWSGAASGAGGPRVAPET